MNENFGLFGNFAVVRVLTMKFRNLIHSSLLAIFEVLLNFDISSRAFAVEVGLAPVEVVVVMVEHHHRLPHPHPTQHHTQGRRSVRVVTTPASTPSKWIIIR